MLDKNAEPIKGTGSGKVIVKDFTYVTLKKSGKKFEKEASVQKQVFK
ncbi:MAG: hypothetical protein VW270_06515 [Candidatus Poseidoniales archaeon]